jgi:hypothetical protein
MPDHDAVPLLVQGQLYSSPRALLVGCGGDQKFLPRAWVKGLSVTTHTRL